jgi:hypothetical protein
MRQRILIGSIVAALALGFATAALAGTLTATGTVAGTAGISLNLPANPSFSSTLDGSDQTASFAPLLGVVDARGSGVGWNLTVAATSFSDGAGHTLAPGTLSAVSSACKAGNSCTAATNTVGYPIGLSGTAAKVFNAAAGSGLGKIDITPTFSVAIPGDAYAGSYTATYTIATATGP